MPLRDIARLLTSTIAADVVGVVRSLRGPEIVANGAFASGLTGWTVIDTAPGATTASNGGATMTNGSTGTARLRQSLAVVAGRSYEVVLTVSGFSGVSGVASLALGNSGTGDLTYGGIALPGNGTYRATVLAAGTLLGLAFSVVAGGATTLTVDDVSVRQIT